MSPGRPACQAGSRCCQGEGTSCPAFPANFQGTADSRWTAPLLDDLKKIPAGAFEAVDSTRLMINGNSGQAKQL